MKERPHILIRCSVRLSSRSKQLYNKLVKIFRYFPPLFVLCACSVLIVPTAYVLGALPPDAIKAQAPGAQAIKGDGSAKIAHGKCGATDPYPTLKENYRPDPRSKARGEGEISQLKPDFQCDLSRFLKESGCKIRSGYQGGLQGSQDNGCSVTVTNCSIPHRFRLAQQHDLSFRISGGPVPTLRLEAKECKTDKTGPEDPTKTDPRKDLKAAIGGKTSAQQTPPPSILPPPSPPAIQPPPPANKADGGQGGTSAGPAADGNLPPPEGTPTPPPNTKTSEQPLPPKDPAQKIGQIAETPARSPTTPAQPPPAANTDKYIQDHSLDGRQELIATKIAADEARQKLAQQSALKSATPQEIFTKDTKIAFLPGDTFKPTPKAPVQAAAPPPPKAEVKAGQPRSFLGRVAGEVADAAKAVTANGVMGYTRTKQDQLNIENIAI